MQPLRRIRRLMVRVTYPTTCRQSISHSPSVGNASGSNSISSTSLSLLVCAPVACLSSAVSRTNKQCPTKSVSRCLSSVGLSSSSTFVTSCSVLWQSAVLKRSSARDICCLPLFFSMPSCLSGHKPPTSTASPSTATSRCPMSTSGSWVKSFTSTA